MIRKALRRANRSYVFTLVLALLFAAGYVGSTYAYFDGSVTDTATYAGGTIGLPILGAAPVPVGYGASFGWTPASIGLNGQAIYEFDHGSNSSCASVTYTALASGVTSTLATTTVTETSTRNGDYICYEVRSTHGGQAGTSGTTTQAYTYTTASLATYTGPTTVGTVTVSSTGSTTVVTSGIATTPVTTVLTQTGLGWYQATDFAGVRVGLIPISATRSNGGTAGQVDNGDIVTVVYNQPVTRATASVRVMACTSATAGQGKVLLDASSCAATPNIGEITGLTMTGAARTYTTATVRVVTTVIAGQTLSTPTVVVTLAGGAAGAGGRTPATGSGSFVGSGSNIKSSVAAATVCNCTTTASGGF